MVSLSKKLTANLAQVNKEYYTTLRTAQESHEADIISLTTLGVNEIVDAIENDRSDIGKGIKSLLKIMADRHGSVLLDSSVDTTGLTVLKEAELMKQVNLGIYTLTHLGHVAAKLVRDKESLGEQGNQ